ncbi:hypothetical protein HAP94_07085 [Acidithiobacillus ferrivorans]|nr:hypothetical protein [Acidithiobacillus ferrivorans]
MSEESEGCLLVDGMADTNTRDTLVGLAKEWLGPEEFIPFFVRLDGLSDVEADHFLVSQCSEQMTTKLALSRAKGRGGWHTPGCSIEHLRTMLKGHLEKGDMVDVLNLAGMILVREQQDRSLQHEPVIGCSHSGMAAFSSSPSTPAITGPGKE